MFVALTTISTLQQVHSSSSSSSSSVLQWWYTSKKEKDKGDQERTLQPITTPLSPDSRMRSNYEHPALGWKDMMLDTMVDMGSLT
ncbi:hypothetical protein GN956_G26269 [Arapaima gigas]